MRKTVGRWRGLMRRESGLRWISGSVKRDGEVERRGGGTERMKENLLARAWQDRSDIYTYVAREINITLWILRSLWKPCQVNKSIKFSHFIGRSCTRLIPEESGRRKKRVYRWRRRERERDKNWERKKKAREKGRYKIKRYVFVVGLLSLLPCYIVQDVPSFFQTWMLGNWFLPSDRWKSGDPPHLEVMIF